MLFLIAFLLFLAWLLELIAARTFGGLINALIIAAILLVYIGIICRIHRQPAEK